jgi:hypothetical protein
MEWCDNCWGRRSTSPCNKTSMLFLICGDAGSPRLGIGAPAADVPTVLPRSRRRRPGAGADVAEVDLRTPADQASVHREHLPPIPAAADCLLFMKRQ